MKIFKLILLGIFLVGLLVGCSRKNSVENPAVKIDNKSTKGTLMVYRPLNPIWRHKRFNIYINGQYKNPLRSNTHHSYKLPAGNYIIEVKEDVDLNPDIFKLKVDLKANKIKYLKFGALSGDGHLKLRRVIKSLIKDNYDWNNKD